MPVLFTCPHCSAQTMVDDCYIGASGPCATCGKPITVNAPEKTRTERSRRPANPEVSRRSVRIVLAGLVVSALVGSLFLWTYVTLLLPEVQRANRLSRVAKVRENLALIGSALRAYHAEHGVFPPAVTRDSAGRPMHSWRVLLLPYLGEEELFRAYRMNEPWDGPANSLLISSMPSAYGDPSDPDSRANGETLFLAISGDGSVFPRTGTVSAGEIIDGASDTMMIAESANCEVCWMEPFDLQLTRMSFTPNSGPDGEAIKTNREGGPLVLLADGMVKELRTDASATLIRGLATIRGGEAIHWNAIAK